MRRYNSFKDRLRERFGHLVYKVGIDAGFDCPNRDGTKGFGGCAYCSQEGSMSPHQDPKAAVFDQIAKGKEFVFRRYGAQEFIVYLQAFTNTYAAPEVLRERYEAVANIEGAVGLAIATRPDCITPEVMDVLEEFSKRFRYFSIELGLQSKFQNRLPWVNRQEEVEDYVRAMAMLKARGISVCTHVILGFPGESLLDMQETVDLAVGCGTHGIKLQTLHVIRGTKLEHIYRRNPFPLPTLEEYGSWVMHLLPRIPWNVEIHRLTGETTAAQLVAPLWVSHKTRFFDWVDKELESRDLRQGSALVLGDV